jgi:hypothetical protein
MKKKPYYDKLFYLTQTTLYNKRNVSMKEYSIFQVNNILQNDSCHLVALFKEYLIYLETSDFFRRYYYLSESYHRIQKLCEYYSLTSLLYPNYICIPEGKYIYKNIMKKQKIIDLLEAMNEKESTRLKKKYKIKGMDDNNNNNKVFDTEIYESIAFKQNQSNINELFGLNNNNNNNNDMNSSINKIDKLVSYIGSFETDTHHMITTGNDKVNSNSNINRTHTTYNAIIPTKKIHKIELAKNRLNIFHPYLNSNNPKLKLHININNTTTTVNKPAPKVVMPPIPLSKHLHTQNQNHNIRHKYLHSLPSELNSYRLTYKKPESTIKRKPTQVNNTTITLNPNNKTNMNNTTTSNNKTITNKKTLSIITTSPLKLFDMKTNSHNHMSSTNTKHISSHSNSKINKRIITSRNKLNPKASLDNHYFTSGWLSERKSNKHYI